MAIEAVKLDVDYSYLDAQSIDETARLYFALTDFEGFIQHPDNVPFTVKKLRSNEIQQSLNNQTYSEHCTGIGVCFDSDHYISPGSVIEFTIQLTGQEQRFTSRVVMVRNYDNNFAIGIWFDRKDDANRIRNTEQICHLENYLRQKRYKEGPFISKEIFAEEWMNKFSDIFPSI